MKKGKRRSTKNRNRKQKVKETYAKAREDAQLVGVIPTEPVGAVRDERVPQCAQTNQSLPALIAQAIRKGWATEDAKKPELVDELVSIVLNPDMPPGKKVAAFNALRMADESQWKRDNPEVDSARGSFVLNVNVVQVESVPARDDAVVILQAEAVVADGNQQDHRGLPEAVAVP